MHDFEFVLQLSSLWDQTNQSKSLWETSRINKWLEGQACDCLGGREGERDTNPQLASRAYSARTASLPNPTLFVNPSSPTYIILTQIAGAGVNSVAEVWAEVLPGDVSNGVISKGIAAPPHPPSPRPHPSLTTISSHWWSSRFMIKFLSLGQGLRRRHWCVIISCTVRSEHNGCNGNNKFALLIIIIMSLFL